MKRNLLLTALIAGIGVTLVTSSAFADFNWGGDCSDGEGSFTQEVPHREARTVGTIPSGKRNVEIALDAYTDIDIRLVDVATGIEIIAWPDGLLSGANEECTTYEDVIYCYSGYNGVNGNPGDEWIRIEGDTNREVEMRVYGYQAGDAEVTYSWMATPTCNEIGSGAFSQYIPHEDSVVVGEIAVDKINVSIELDAHQGMDLDMRLYDGDIAIIAWPDGLMAGPNPQEITYEGMTISYSGYNGIDDNWGNERIEITGRISTALRMEAYGFSAGNANVIYSWGVGVGDMCGGIGNIQCSDGLICKESSNIPDGSGICHTPTWCMEASDCDNLSHPNPGTYSCEEYVCQWQNMGPARDECGLVIADTEYISHDLDECAVIRYTCDAPQEPFSNDCGCGCGSEILYQ